MSKNRRNSALTREQKEQEKKRQATRTAIEWWQNNLRRCSRFLPDLTEKVKGIVFPDPSNLEARFGFDEWQIRPDPKVGRWDVLDELMGHGPWTASEVPPEYLSITTLTLDDLRNQDLLDFYGVTSIDEARRLRSFDNWLSSLPPWRLDLLILQFEVAEAREKLGLKK